MKNKIKFYLLILLMFSIAIPGHCGIMITINNGQQNQLVSDNSPKYFTDALKMTITTEVDAFVANQNVNRNSTDGVSQYFNLLSGGTAPTGDDTVTGIAGIASNTTLNLGTGYNAVILDGSHSVQASANGQPDNYSFSVSTSGAITVLDSNTGHSETITGADYLIFNGAATGSTGAFQSIYFVEGSQDAQVAALYNAALGRQPDLAGLEFYSVPIKAGTLDLHTAATYFLASPEFLAKFPAAAAAADDGGVNDQAYIKALYENVLHRDPSAAEVTYYVEDLQGKLPGVAAQDRAQLLVNFAESPENQSDISSWLINPSSGYADAGAGAPNSESSTSVLTVSAGGTINTALIDKTTVTGGFTEITDSSGNLLVTYNPAQYLIYSKEAGITIDLSNNAIQANIEYTGGDTVNTSQTGGDLVLFSNDGGTANLAGVNNILSGLNLNKTSVTGDTAPTALVVTGFTAGSGDYIEFNRGFTSLPTTTTIITPTTGQVIQGSSYGATSANALNFGNANIAIDVGTVTDNSAAAMATAAAKVYNPMTAAQAAATSGFPDTVVFFGQGANHDTVIYLWEADSTHQLSAATMQEGVDLVGILPSQITASMIHV